MKLYRLADSQEAFIFVNGEVPDGFEVTLADFGYKLSGGHEALVKALLPDGAEPVLTPDPEAKPTPKKRRSLLGF